MIRSSPNYLVNLPAFAAGAKYWSVDGKPDVHRGQFTLNVITAAHSPTSGVAGSHPVTIERPHLQILNSKDDVAIGWIENAEIVPIPEEILAERKRRAWNNDRFALLGCDLAGFMILFLVFSGMILWSGIVTS